MSRLTLHEHPFAAYCWKALIAAAERDVEIQRVLVEDRAPLAEIWPLTSIPVLVDRETGLVVPESSVVVEYLDRFGDAPPLVPADRDAALQARLWDRVLDGHVMTPMQTIVGDVLRPEGERDPYGVAQARDALTAAYRVLDDHLAGHGAEWLTGDGPTLADCTAVPALFYARMLRPWDPATHPSLDAYDARLLAWPAAATVVRAAVAIKHYFPLPWDESRPLPAAVTG